MAPRDYKKGPRQSPRKATRQRSPWLYFVLGLTTGVAASALVYFNELIPVPLYVAPEQAPKQQREDNKRTTESNKPNAPKPRFEFYTLLPEMEVAVPDAELKPGSASARSAPPTAPGTYYLQAGSFRLPEEADKMKANLAFLGLESSIQTVAINGADTWHRVRIGPFSDLAELNEARRRLKENEIESIVLKVKG